MTTQNHIDLVNQVSAHNYLPLPIVLSGGEGVWVTDVEGRRYLDCLSAYSALNQGHRHPKILKALLEQAEKITLTSRAFHNDQMGPFLRRLCELSKMEMSLPMNTGAEAVETAIKSARRWGYRNRKVAANEAEIIVCRNNFHGRTTTIVGFSSEEKYKKEFGPFSEGFKLIDFNDTKALEEAITPNTVAFMVEPIQGEAGILIPDDGYLNKVREICSRAGILMMLDEIQTGLGRTGKFFAYEHESNAKPDVLIVGKALGGGVIPVSAVLSSKEVLGVFGPGDHGSTFGGNPLASAVGLASLNVIVDEKLVERSFEQGQYLMEALRKIESPHIKTIRGKGLMVAVEIKTSSGSARPFCEALMDKGILAKETHQQVIRLAPPLTIERQEIDLLIDKLRSCLQ